MAAVPLLRDTDRAQHSGQCGRRVVGICETGSHRTFEFEPAHGPFVLAQVFVRKHDTSNSRVPQAGGGDAEPARSRCCADGVLEAIYFALATQHLRYAGSHGDDVAVIDIVARDASDEVGVPIGISRIAVSLALRKLPPSAIRHLNASLRVEQTDWRSHSLDYRAFEVRALGGARLRVLALSDVARYATIAGEAILGIKDRFAAQADIAQLTAAV